MAGGRRGALEFGHGGVGWEGEQEDKWKEWEDGMRERVMPLSTVGQWSLVCVVAAFYPEMWDP